MATFRSGFKIFGEITLRQSIGRLRSFSEDRKPVWQPEDQWAVRPPCTTCPPDPNVPHKPAKSSKSWLSICRDPKPPLTCDIRHNNCPAPPPEDEPWYAFMTKKKVEKPKPPLESCRVEMERQAENDDEPFCEDIVSTTWPGDYQRPTSSQEETVCKERPPAPVIRLSCPPPKDLDLMLWCGKPGLSVARIASQCQTDRMPYDEFKPRKCWKAPPFSLPCKGQAPASQPFCSNIGRAPFSEYKQVEIPKPLYTRYKSVELQDENFLLCMTDVTCPSDEKPSLAIQPPPLQKAPKVEDEKQKEICACIEKPVLVAASMKPVKLRSAPTFKFRPKPTKLIERRHMWNPCAQHNTYNLQNMEPPKTEHTVVWEQRPICNEPPKVITGTLTNEPQTYERNLQSRRPPHWMYMLSKPGSKDTPLVPHADPYPSEPDWCGETDGLKFYDGKDEGISPKPPPDPCKKVANQPEDAPPCPSPPPQPLEVQPPAFQEKFVLMPDEYNIRNMRPVQETTANKEDFREPSFQEFIDSKASNLKSCSKSYPPIKENILYDLIRNCPLPPLDPTKPDPPARRAPPPKCPQPTRYYYRRYSTFRPSVFRRPDYSKVFNRMKSDDSRGKCKARSLLPKPRECNVQEKFPTCNELELPCCPKPRLPPRCDVKKPLPPCRKKLAPKPSFSECQRDPPPCPRITECNAWEKRDFENKKGPSKGRRFSNWAPEQEVVAEQRNEYDRSGLQCPSGEVGKQSEAVDGPTAPGPSYSEYLDVVDRGQPFINRSKWPSSSKYAHKQRKVFSGKELMLNFVNPTEDGNSYYKSDKLVSKRRKPLWGKLKTSQIQSKKIDRSVGNQLHEQKVISALLQDHHTRNDARLKSLSIHSKEEDLSPYNSVDSPPKAIAGSIGSWINGFLKAQRKRSQSCPLPQKVQSQHSALTYVDTVDVDRIMKLTNPFIHKKSRSLENLYTYYPAESSLGVMDQKKTPSPFRRLWGRHRNRSLAVFPRMKRERARCSMWKYESLSPIFDYADNSSSDKKTGKSTKEGQKPIEGRSKVCYSRKQKPGRRLSSESKSELISRLGCRKLEEFVIPTVDHAGGRSLLFNIKRNFHEGRKCEPINSHQNPSRRYTALMQDSPACPSLEDNSTSSAMKRNFKNSTKKRRGSASCMETSTFSRETTPRPLKNNRRMETNAYSEDLVQNLIKKVKFSRLGPSWRKDGSSSSSSGRFKPPPMAGNAVYRKEIDGSKHYQRGNGDIKFSKYSDADKAIMPLTVPQQSWIYIDRGHDSNIRYDVKKHIAHATVIKTKNKKWIHEIDDYVSDPREYTYTADGKKAKKKQSDLLLKDDLKYCADKYLKRQEVRNMLSKLELKKSIRKVAENTMKIRLKEQTKKDVMCMLDNTTSKSPDKVLGRFGWQHALFRSNTKQNKNATEAPAEVAPQHPETVRQHSLIDVRETEDMPRKINVSLSEIDIPKKLNNVVELYDTDLNLMESFLSDSRTAQTRVDNLRKLTRLRDVTDTLKWNKPQMKEGRPKDHDQLIGSYTYERASHPSLEQREPKTMVPTVMATEPTPTPFHTVIHRKHTTDAWKCSEDPRQCGDQNAESIDEKCSSNKSKEHNASGCAETNSKKNSNRDSGNKTANEELDCRRDKVKKPGPNCPND